LTGLPASGKSTFAKILKLVIENSFDDSKVIIIDPDIIREKLTHNKFEPEKEHLVRTTNLKLIKKELKKGNIVISDDLNYYSSMRHDLKDIAESLNAFFFILHISTPFETCLKWNENRGQTIPNEIIKKIQGKFDDFGKYSWDLPLASFNLSEIDEIDATIGVFIKNLVKRIKNISLKDKENRRNHSNRVIENLEKISRSIVGDLLKNPILQNYKDEIIQLRRLFVKKNKNKKLKDAEITRLFMTFLEKRLNIEVP
jgi:tRNA uridine 5-carbamoylmethylation protein Kti12